ncbi:flavin reductase family protein [Actinokineospora pegani]|uniref:flavin reductase family protein n=1 Tax=Actinokineospora pegani TaxID=2654637 RepID=UPI0018D27EC3|nr:flavin reductase family protein [Actinokineospora pegani]
MSDRNEPQDVREDDFRALMAGFPTGVSVVTALSDDGAPWGMTCSSVCSVTVEPPTLLVCLRTASPTLAAVLDRATFAVNLLEHDARRTAELFASGDPFRFDRVEWTVDEEARGPHLRSAAHSVADCAVVRSETVGDHTVVMGTVERVLRRGVRRPLLYGLRSYSAWPEPAVTA